MNTSTETPDKLAVFRAQARQDAAENASHAAMSSTAKAKLRELNDTTKSDKLANETFVQQFAKLPKDVRSLVHLYKRLFGHLLEVSPITGKPASNAPSDATLERMAEKLRWSLAHGWLPTESHDVVFMGTLAPDEERMSDDAFLSHLERAQTKHPIPLSTVRNAVYPSQVITADTYEGLVFADINGLDAATAARIAEVGLEAWLDGDEESSKPATTPHRPQKTYWTEDRCRKMGLCKAGPLCIKASNTGKPAPRKDGKQFCGTNCQECYPVRLRKRATEAVCIN